MARVSFENLPEQTNNGSGDGIAFFGLKNNEEAIVRILIDSTDDFDIHTVHNVKMQGYEYGRRVNCIRDPQQPIEACPLCVAKAPLMQKIFIKIIQYSADPTNGTIVAQPKVWERSAGDRNFGARALKSCLDTFGPISNMVCKIIRRGEGLNTEYQFIPNLPANVYRPDLYVKDTSMFENYTPLGRAILDKNYDELNIFLSTGQFPNPNNSAEAANAQATPRNYQTDNTGMTYPNTPTYNNVAPANPAYNPSAEDNIPASVPNNVPGVTVPNNNPVVNNNAAPAFNSGNPAPKMPWQNSAAPSFERPRRY